MNGEAGESAKLGGKGLSLCRLGAGFSGKVHGIANHNGRDSESATEAGQGAKIFAAAGAALECEHGLRGEAKLVGHGHSDAPVADVKCKVTQGIVRLLVLHHI